MDYYEILGISRTASAAEIERAFRAVARKVHPDLNLGDGNAEARMKQLNHMRDTLVDPLLRAAYDDRLRQEAVAPAPTGAASGRDERPRRSPFAGSRAAPRARWSATGTRGKSAPATVAAATSPSPAPLRPGRRWLAALALMVLPVVGVLAVRGAREPPGGGVTAPVNATGPSTATTPVTTPTPVTTTAPVTTTTPVMTTPTARSASGETETPRATTARVRVVQRRGGVVRLGSTSSQVLNAFGRPDRIDRGAHPGDATMIYGDLRLDLRNGRVAAGVPGRGIPEPTARH